MAKTILIILQIILLANALLAQSCKARDRSCPIKNKCKRCSSCEMVKISPVPCYNTNDLVIVLDASGSVTSPNYDKAKIFVDKLASAYNKQSSSRVAFIVYSQHVRTEIPLNNTLTPAAMSSTILNATYDESVTNTHLGIYRGIAELTPARAVPRNMVVLTDGASTKPIETAEAATKAKADGIRTFAVGIGFDPKIKQEELIIIANGDERQVYAAKSFDDLVNVLNPLSRALCS